MKQWAGPRCRVLSPMWHKQADWPLAEQDKVRKESQTENDEMKNRVSELPNSQMSTPF